MAAHSLRTLWAVQSLLISTVSAAECKSVNGWLNCTLKIEEATVHLPFKNISFRARTYNGTVPGPVLRAAPGDRVRILLKNRLGGNLPGSGCDAPLSHLRAPNSSNLHVHGVYADATEDNTFACVDPGQDFLYTLTLKADSGTSTKFYHPHLDGSSSMQLYGGMAGAFVVVDSKQDQILESFGDATLVLQMLDFNPRSKDYIETVLNMGGLSTLPIQLHNPANFTGLVLLSNGEVEPTMVLPSRQGMRLKLINAVGGAGYSMNVGFLGPASRVCQLHVLAYDGVYIQRPRLQSSVFIPAGGRADVAVMCEKKGLHQIGTLLTGVEDYGGVFPPGHVILALDNKHTGKSTSVLPATLPGPPPFYPDLSSAHVHAHHAILLSTEQGANVVNGWPYNGSVSHTAQQFQIQEWHLFGGEGWGLQKQHPYHQHMTHFQITDTSLDTKGLIAAVGDYRDTVPLFRSLNYTVRFIPPFTGRMMIHCHVLKHEDMGMMTLVNFTPPAPSSLDTVTSKTMFMPTVAAAITLFGLSTAVGSFLCLKGFRAYRCPCQSDYHGLP